MLIYGRNVCREKLLSNDRINKVYLSNSFNDKEILSLIKKRKVNIKYLSNKELDNLTKGLNQKIALEVDDVKTYDISIIEKEESPVVVMLDHIEDPHNMGAIIRSCEALGVNFIIIPNNRSVNINSTVVKTSAGAIDNVKIIRVSNLTSCINRLKDIGYWIVGTDMLGEDYTKIDYNMKVCLIIGNEGKGISKIVRDNCDYIASIPMKGKVNSLNASVSCGIVLSEIVRQKGGL